ncbi:hypothetical protein MM710_37075, partial [Klebsiella pneumoniae]|nr:hypothetical protein [Klebsiella pneumoniae]
TRTVVVQHFLPRRFQHGFGQYGRAGGKIVNRIKRHDAALILNNNPPDFRLAAGFVQGWEIPVLRPASCRPNTENNINILIYKHKNHARDK